MIVTTMNRHPYGRYGMDYWTLSYDAQIERLTTLAHAALAAWGIPPKSVELVSYANNAVFRVHDGHFDYGLRVYRPGQKDLATIQAEQAWLRLPSMPRVPVPARPLYHGALDGVDGPVTCSVWYWIPGEVVVPANLTPQQVRQIGMLMARFHGVSADGVDALVRRDPVLAHRPRLDYEGLFGERSPYNPGAGSQYISAASQTVLDEVAEQVRGVMQQMDGDESAFGLIHGDFIFKNTLFTPEGDVAAIDFDDCGFGYYLYDVACPLLFYKPLPDYETLMAALWDGYTAVRPLPKRYRAHLEVLVAGRYVASCRWVAGNAEHPNIRGKAREIIDGRVAELQDFLQTGRLSS
jgi:Ser/Thr protein kinase RdoA (MazF antagonist)